jgi:hypothetical protein
MINKITAIVQSMTPSIRTELRSEQAFYSRRAGDSETVKLSAVLPDDLLLSLPEDIFKRGCHLALSIQ